MTDILEMAQKQIGKRKNSSLKSIVLNELAWSTKHNAALFFIQNSLWQAIKLGFPKDDHVLFVFTDASVEFWADIVMQKNQYQLSKNTKKQHHEPMTFLVGRFIEAQRS